MLRLLTVNAGGVSTMGCWIAVMVQLILAGVIAGNPSKLLPHLQKRSTAATQSTSPKQDSGKWFSSLCQLILILV
jgi:hypothetical protein